MRDEAVIEAHIPSNWSEDFFLVALFALVGALGIGAGIAADSQVEMSIGLILVLFAAKVLGDILRQRRGPPLRRRSPHLRRPTARTCSRAGAE
jgi:hypothetical protein